MSRKLDRLLATAKESMECGYFRVHTSNRQGLLGQATDNRGVDDLLFGFLNLDEREGSRVVSSSMAYCEAPVKQIKPLLSGLANVALTEPLGISGISYVDMAKGLESKKSFKCLNRRLENLRETTKSSSLIRLILVNAGLSPQDKQLERADSLVNSLAGFPPEIFRVGMVASADFIEAVGLDKGLKEETEQPKADAVSQPIPVAG
jgi:hypothetical protein